MLIGEKCDITLLTQKLECMIPAWAISYDLINCLLNLSNRNVEGGTGVGMSRWWNGYMKPCKGCSATQVLAKLTCFLCTETYAWGWAEVKGWVGCNVKFLENRKTEQLQKCNNKTTVFKEHEGAFVYPPSLGGIPCDQMPPLWKQRIRTVFSPFLACIVFHFGRRWCWREHFAGVGLALGPRRAANVHGRNCANAKPLIFFRSKLGTDGPY